MKRTTLFVLSLALLFAAPSLALAEKAVTPSAAPAAASVATYEELRQAILKARAASTTRIEKAVDQEKVREAWEIGKLIDTHVLQHKERADYGEKVLQRLSADIGTSHTELKYMLQFYRAYPIGRPADQLSWSQYEALLAVNDSKERDALAEKAVKEKWNRDKTREEVKKVKVGKAKDEASAAAEKAPEPELLKAAPGKPGTYRIVKAGGGSEAGKAVIDLGFSNYYKTSKDLRFKEGAIIEVLYTFPGGGSSPSDKIRLLREPRASNSESRGPSDASRLLYTYRASVVRVLDGDTIEVIVDLGFGVRSIQTLRLRGIDCPELVSREGKEAKAFVEQALACPVDRGPCPAILIKTTKSDKYDRYLADVFVSRHPGQSEGSQASELIYLNNELLEKCYAVRVSE